MVSGETAAEYAVRTGALVPLDPAVFLDGKAYTLHGVSGTFHLEVRPYRTEWVEDERYLVPVSPRRSRPKKRVEIGPWHADLVHEADEEGRQSEEYDEVRSKLGDDYTTTLSDWEDVYNIALELGYDEWFREQAEEEA